MGIVSGHVTGLYRFGRFDLHMRERELRKDRVRLRLQDQPFEVLAMLLERPGETVTRDELRRRLWPDGTFVDFEHGLNAAVKRLRAALGDDADRPRFVETLPRRGYRFIASVERLAESAAASSSGTNGNGTNQPYILELMMDRHAETVSGTTSPAARQAYLKGRYHWNKSGPSGVLESIGFFQEAVAVDPQFASAHGALGRALVAAAEYYLREPRSAFDEASGAAARALALDPSESQAHLTVAEVTKAVHWDWQRTEAAYRRALACNQRNEGAYRLYGLFLAARGRWAEAIAAARRACELEPFCLSVNTNAAWVRYLARQYDDAIDMCQHTLDMDPDFVNAHRVLGAALLQVGHVDEAILELEASAAFRSDPVSSAWLAHALGAAGHSRRAGEIVGILTERVGRDYVSAYHLALAQVGVGDGNRAISSLETAFAEHDPALISVGFEPRLEPLRSDPRFHALIERMGLRNGQD
jgi:DNA-binding winged helix-turn-helix (wHTH) protein/Tfp pilus assembly protein PilF